jgi:hypothetical protein
MKTQAHPNFVARLWHRIARRSAPAHDPLLSLSIGLFNFSTGWDRLLQKRTTSL